MCERDTYCGELGWRNEICIDMDGSKKEKEIGRRMLEYWITENVWSKICACKNSLDLAEQYSLALTLYVALCFAFKPYYSLCLLTPQVSHLRLFFLIRVREERISVCCPLGTSVLQRSVVLSRVMVGQYSPRDFRQVKHLLPLTTRIWGSPEEHPWHHDTTCAANK